MKSKNVIKVVLVGDSDTGKTSLLSRYIEGGDYCNECIKSTIGVEFRYKTEVVGGREVTLQVWDTAGQERYRSIYSAYYRNVNFAVVVFSADNQDSFSSVQRWIKDIRSVNTGGVSIALVKNKFDLLTTFTSSGKKKANELGCFYYGETSSVTGEGVRALFSEIASYSKQSVFWSSYRIPKELIKVVYV